MGVTSLATPWVIRLAARLGAMDLPGGRKTHAEPIPRIGGVAVFLGFVAGLATAAFLSGVLLERPQVDVHWIGLVLAATLIFLFGILDDLWDVSFYWKFAAQILCAVYVWNAGFRIDIISHPLGGQIELGALSLPVTVLWIVGITNAVNLIDGLDGLAAGTALITTVSVAVIAFAMNSLGVTATCVALAGSLIGFLRYNFNPARIFLGDSGSMFLGFVLAVASVRSSQKLPTALLVMIVPMLVLALPLLDTGMAIVRRLYRLTSRGRQTDGALRYVLRNLDHVFLPDREHLHHRLIDLGLSHRGAVLALYCVGLVFAVVAFTLTFAKSSLIGFLLLGLVVCAMAALLAVLYFRIRRLGEARDEPVDEPSQSPEVGESWSPPSRQVQGR
jgi:UDP-GlcNAc:undecaprenyl-phosphate GlcNAc-1-phosphate transferase